jgi:hypothetical protein
MIFARFGSNLIWNFYFEFRFNQELTRALFWLARTPSGGSRFLAVRSKGIWTPRICWYPFVKWTVLILRIKIRRTREREGISPWWLGFRWGRRRCVIRGVRRWGSGGPLWRWGRWRFAAWHGELDGDHGVVTCVLGRRGGVAGDVGASGVAGVLDLLCNRTITVKQKVRQGERREMVQKRGRRVLHCTGIRRRFACSSEDSGEKFVRPGGDFRGKWKGRRWRRSRAFYRRS